METPARPALLTTSPMASMRHLLGAWFSVFVVAVVRVVAFGWRPISPDDSLYLLVGRGVLSGAGPTWRGGLLWLDRSPAFGTLLAVGDRLYPSDVFTGAHLMAFLLAMFSVAAMIILANLLGGRPAIWVSVAALMSLTLWWQILPAVRIDFIHIAAILVTLILLSARERPRWLLAGVAVGISILIKESAILLLGLPVAFIGAMSVRELLAGVGRYLAGFAIAVSWWWAYVYIQSGEIYLITDGVGVPARLGFADTSWHWTTMLALVMVVAAWLLFVVRYVRVPAGRLLILALLAFAPRFVLTYVLGLEPRLYLTGLVLSLVVVGIVGADASAALQAHKAGGRHRGVRFGVYGIVGVVLIAGIGIGQTRVPRPAPQPAEVAEIARAVEAALPRGSRIAVSFKHRGLLALNTDDAYAQITIWPDPVGLEDPEWAGMQWVTLRAGTLRGISRSRWYEIRSEVDGLVIFWPHVMSAAALWPLLSDDRAHNLGYEPGVVSRDVGGGVFVIVDASWQPAVEEVPLHATTKAAIEILQDDVDAAGFLAEEPVLRGSFRDLDSVSTLLPPDFCMVDLRDAYEPGVVQIAFGVACVDTKLTERP